ncbi:MAG TPA: PQQ-binding-like beta-propeller repeat protein, partial [Gemmataceae bacterium]|nr:PQQ-binding-like beta-propeller repeat protein [Gemmataceae bacterium]
YEKDLPDHWSPDPNKPDNNLVWKQPYGGRSTPIVMHGRVYLINSAGEGLNGQERVLCFNADTGEVLWQYKFNVWHTDIDILRVGWTNLEADPETDYVYAQGTQGLTICFDKNGKVVWKHSLTEEYGRISGYGGRMSSPVIDGNLVIIGMLNASWGEHAMPANRWLAMDKRTGEPVWWSASPNRPKDTYASTPVVAVINGERLLITGGGDGFVHAMKVRTGERVWSYECATGGISSSPVVSGSYVYIAHGEGNPDRGVLGRILCLDASKVKRDPKTKEGKPALVWEKYGIQVRYTTPLLHQDRLYVSDINARLWCFNAKTGGKELWRFTYGRNAKGSPVWADGKIYVADVNSRFHILKPQAKKCVELDKQFFPSPDGVSDVEINGNAAVANGRIYFNTSFEFYCIGKKDHEAGSVSIPPQPKEEPAPAVDKVAHVQIVPAEVMLKPGQSVSFRVLAYDNEGRFLGEIKEPTYALAAQILPPPIKQNWKGELPPLKGKLSPDGKLTVDKEPEGQFGAVVAKNGALTTRARVRVLPDLDRPYQEDFKKLAAGTTPAGWVNTQGKFTVVPRNGAKVLKKLSNMASPLFSRAHAFIGPPDMADYTIQADLLGTRKGSDMPDMGLTANRYILVLDGNKQELRIISWESTPRPRVDKTIEHPWKPDTWYTLKLTVEVKGDKASIRGKVWPRGETEPKHWSIEFEDPTPNRHGSPTLYAYVGHSIREGQTGAEVFYDNVRITPNER